MTTNDREILISRLKEAGFSTRHFLKVDKNKAAFEDKWQLNLYTPEELKDYPLWGICGKNGLVLCDIDKPEMIKFFRENFPATLVAKSPRRGLPHFYYKIVGGKVPNRVLHIPGDYDEKGRLRGAGEIRAQNYYLVAPGTTIEYKDLKTGELKTGTYKIVEDRPIATIQYEEFKKKIKPYLGKDAKQPITLEQMKEGVPEGTRHHYGIRYANFLIAVQGFDYSTALFEMKRWNQTCQPPMDEKDLEHMVKNAISYQSNPEVQKEYTEKKRRIESGKYISISSEFAKQIWESPELVRHVFSDLGRRVKRDNITKASVHFAALSAYLKEPLNLFEKGTSGSGKTYNAIETLEYFPEEDIWFLGGMSPKALVHEKSQLLDKDGNEIFFSERPTKPKKRDFKTESEYDNAAKVYEKQIKEFNKRLRDSYHYINIEGKIFVFLETPDPETMRILYPILSHDKRRIEYRFVNKTPSGGLRTERVIIEGFPTAIFLTVDRKYVEELATRSFTVSPEESSEKISDANKLTNLKVAVPWKCKLETPRFKAIKKLILDIRNLLRKEKIDVIVPFLGLHELFPTDIARDMRDFTHFTQFLKAFTILHVYQRPILEVGEKKYVITTNYDVLCCFNIFKELIESTRTGTEKKILDFYRDYIKGNVKLYVSSLTTAYNEKHRVPISDYTIRKWLNRLNQIGYVEKQEDDKDKRKNVYVPLINDPEKLESVCDFEDKGKISSILEKGFKKWLNEYLKTSYGKLKEKFSGDKTIVPENLGGYVLLDEKKLFSYADSVFKYLSEPKISSILEKEPKNICSVEKKVNSNILATRTKCKICNKPLQSNYFKVDDNPVCFDCYFDAKPRTCPICGNDMPTSQLSSIDGKPACKSCAKKLGAQS